MASCVPDKSNEIVYPTLHLETIFYSTDKNYNEDSLELIYGAFWQDYKQGILYVPENKDINSIVAEITADKDFAKSISLIQQNYQEFDDFSLELSDAFVNYKKFFPSKKAPKLVTYFGAFNFPVAVNENTLAIGLEMFLEPSFYKDLSYKYPPYMHHQFSSEFMICTAMYQWLKSEFVIDRGGFLQNIIYQGKLKYILSNVLDKEEHVVMQYTPDQLQWCYSNEFPIWNFLISKGLLFSNDRFEIEKYINPAPSSKGMPNSPGQVVNWVGYQIVKKFMKNNPDLSLEELMLIKDPQYILQQSKYKP